jgi:hypothetical protein
MKKILFFILFPFLLSHAGKIEAHHNSPIKPFHFSLWSEYKQNSFDGMSNREKTAMLQRIFQEQLQFIQTHENRRLIIKILDPSSFEFFQLNRFDSSKDDNFYYWAIELSQFAEIEALFDCAPFQFSSKGYFEECYDYFKEFLDIFKKDSPFGEFQNLYEKLEWVTIINEMFDSSHTRAPLISGLTLDPKGAGKSDPIYQNLVNALDQYKFNASSTFPPNYFPSLRRGIILNMDEKDLSLANLSRFPLRTDLKGEQWKSIGILLPSTFPSQGEIAPSWRIDNSSSLLETVYVKLYDSRLIEPIYQNYATLPEPAEEKIEAAAILSNNLGNNFRGIPFVKGPGYISSLMGTTTILGKYTFLKTGEGPDREGRFIDGQAIEIRPPFVSAPIRKVVSGEPLNNKEMTITSCFSTTTDIIEAEYYYTPIPVNWTRPKISEHIRSHIYFVLSTEYEAPGERYMGNWHIKNFLNFILNGKKQTGWLKEPIFMNFNGKLIPPSCNLVIYDYSTIPNGTGYSVCDWNLGNTDF